MSSRQVPLSTRRVRGAVAAAVCGAVLLGACKQMPSGPPAAQAKALFGVRCAPCHGKAGAGDGAAAMSLVPKPRNYHDLAWQRSTSDALIAKAIVEGGPAVGKSSLMPPNPDLKRSPEVVAELVKLIRAFASHR